GSTLSTRWTAASSPTGSTTSTRRAGGADGGRSRRRPAVVDGTHGVDRIRILGALVGPVALDPGEPEGHPSRVSRARLDAVERHLDDELGLHVHGGRVAAQLELLEPNGLPRED